MWLLESHHQHLRKLPKCTKEPSHHQGSLLKRVISCLSEIALETLGWFDVLLAQASKSRLSESPLKPMKIRLNRGLEAQP